MATERVLPSKELIGYMNTLFGEPYIDEACLIEGGVPEYLEPEIVSLGKLSDHLKNNPKKDLRVTLNYRVGDCGLRVEYETDGREYGGPSLTLHGTFDMHSAELLQNLSQLIPRIRGEGINVRIDFYYAMNSYSPPDTRPLEPINPLNLSELYN